MVNPVNAPTYDPQLAPSFSSLSGNYSENTHLINKVFKQLDEIIGTLQSVAATQANRLTYYGQLQQAYTNMMGSIPNITSDQLKELGLNSSERGVLLNQLTTLNQAYSDNMRNYRDVVTDNSQSYQSVVNQSNQEVQQQADLASSLLQEASTILQSIYTPG